MAIENGKVVTVDYVGTFSDGTVFDSSIERGEPLKFEIGSGQVIKGFEKAVEDMQKGQKKKVSLKATQAYGDHNPDLVQKVDRKSIPDEANEGMVMLAKTQNGQEVPVRLLEIGDDSATIDMNHPLAGKDLEFEITLLSVG